MFIRLLGTVGAGADEAQVVSAPGRVTAGVLAHLALARGREVTADRLADLIWDEPPETYRNAVQVAVSKLRKLYGTELVSSGRGGYRMSAELIRVDLHEVEQLISDARAALAAGRWLIALKTVESALDLFHGPPLSGLDVPESVTTRHHAERLWHASSLLRAQALLGLGQAADAVDLLQVLVAAEPLDEPAHLALMTALAQTGRRSEALGLYDQLRRRLADELGVDPSADAVALFTRLLGPDTGELAPPDATAGQPVGRARVIGVPKGRSPIVGRTAELAQLSDTFTAGHRLITVLGPGGIGKTRLALEAARSVADAQDLSVYFVDLTEARDDAQVQPTVAAVLGARDGDFVDVLHGSPTLVVLDNAEHVLPAVAEVAATLLDIDDVSLLITSRSPLRLRGERLLWLAPLAVDGESQAAVNLLADLADLDPADRGPQAADLNALARHADGVPLVLEMLASALRWRTASELVADLEQTLLRFDDQERDRPLRHLSVTAATEWSLERASATARAALGALVLPRGTFSLNAAEDLIAATAATETTAALLRELVDLSLVQRLVDPGRIRFKLLEPIRVAALSSPLVPEAGASVQHAFALHFFKEVQAAERELRDSDERVFRLVRGDRSNLSAALDWAWHHDRDLAMERLGGILYAWYYSEFEVEAAAWADKALPEQAVTSLAGAQIAIVALLTMQWTQSGTREEMQQWAQQILPFAHLLAVDWHNRWVQTQADLAIMDGNEMQALEILEGFRAGSEREAMIASNRRMNILIRAGQSAKAIDELLERLEAPGSRQHTVERVVMLNGLGYALMMEGRYNSARQYLSEADKLAVHQGAYVVLVRNNQAWLALAEDQSAAALGLLAGVIHHTAFESDRLYLCEGLVIAGLALHQLGAAESAQAAAAAAKVTNNTLLTPDPYFRAQFHRLQVAAGVSRGTAGEEPVALLRRLVLNHATGTRSA